MPTIIGILTFINRVISRKKFQLLIERKVLKNSIFPHLKHSDVALFLLINVKMSTIVGILNLRAGLISCSVELSIKKI